MNAMTAEDRGVSNRLQNGFASPSSRRKGGGRLKWLLSFVGALGVGGAICYLVYSRYYAGDSTDGLGKVLTTPVKRTDLLITVTEDGNVESAKNLELKCKVPGPITILEIVPDGSHVKEGDELVKLDSYSTEDSITTQTIAVAKALAAKITSEKNFSAAKIAVKEYEEGTFVQEMQQYEADIIVAKQNLSSAENLLHYSRKMHRKGYVTQLDVESKEFAVEQAKLNLAVAERKKDVLEKYTREKTLEQLRSVRDSAEALMTSDLAAFEKETRTLAKFEQQLKDCTIIAPADGMVVYANDMGGGFRMQQTPKIEQGASVNQYQAILKLPDLKHMQVKALVHETKVDQLHLGMRTRIKIQDLDFQGEITSIANQPEATSWFQGTTKEYATLISIDGEPTDLKPGMTAEVEILVAEKTGVLTIPVQCVVQSGNKFHAYVKTRQGVEPRDLVLGGTNDTVIEVMDGVKEGEQVLLNPRADVPDASEETQEAEKIDVSKRFGAARLKADTTAAPVGGGVAAGAPAGTAPAPGRPAAGGEGGARPREGRGGPAGFKLPTFKELDKDGDGKITKEENPSPYFDQQDTDHDGAVTAVEFKAAMDAFRKMMQERAMNGGGGPGGGGPPGGGQ